MIERLSGINPAKSVTGCIYGGAGKGKTWMMGTAGSRTLYCNVEGRLATLQGKDFKSKYEFDPIVLTVTEEPIPDGGAKALVELTEKINDAIDKYSSDFDVIIVDGASALRRFAMNMGLELNSKTGKSKSLDNKKTLSPDFPVTDITIQDFAMEMALIEKFIIQIKDYCFNANKHFFITAHERIEYNQPARIGDAPTVRSIKPGFTGRTFPDSIPGLFDIVWHTETKGAGERIEYFARTQGDESLIAKTCFNGLFPVLVKNPSIADILTKIKNA